MSMGITNSDEKNVKVEITKNGVTITKQDKITWSADYSWDDISSIEIDTSEQNISTNTSDSSDLPISITEGEITVGHRETNRRGSLREFEQEDEKVGFWEQVEEKTGIQYDPKSGDIKFPEDKSLTEASGHFLQFMFDEGYMSKEDLPWATPQARKNYVLNTEAVHQDGEEMDAAEPIPGIFLDRKIPRDQRRRHIKLLAKQFADM